MANYHAPFNISSYNGTVTKDYIVNYVNNPNYEQDGSSIVSASGWMNYNNKLSANELTSVLSRLVNDPTWTLGRNLYAEDCLYQLNAL